MTTHAIARPIHWSPAKLILWTLTLIGAGAAVTRYIYGMGAISNMNNSYSFGLWISLDLLCGVALAAGAFTVCASVYILGLKQFQPLLRPSVLTGFLGYVMVVVALLVDLGRPERIWHMIIYWNPHSPLFEVGLCVMTYTTVLLLEFLPVMFEGWGWHQAVERMHKISIGLVVFGVVLSTLHQSSLGSLFLIMADKLNPLWHSPLLPIFFFLSAICVGLAMVVVESSISTRAYGRKPEVALLSRLVKALPWLLGLYLALKLGELAVAGELGLLFKPGLPTGLFWTELLGGVTLPMILLAIPAVRQNQVGLITGAVLVIAGLMLNRFDIGLIAWTRPAGASYFPHLLEFALSFGVISAGVLAYDWVARHFPLFAEADHEGKEGSTHAA
ncbi:MAG TPA: Ni/Fe-hydrogenase cytochrome b subunit [Symbiobacteriaceae bacterium]|nr:Ni/Fe-hydrogenase cytochrome b subunit [Symbiobacteriaceae bacterium]